MSIGSPSNKLCMHKMKIVGSHGPVSDSEGIYWESNRGGVTVITCNKLKGIQNPIICIFANIWALEFEDHKKDSIDAAAVHANKLVVQETESRERERY